MSPRIKQLVAMTLALAVVVTACGGDDEAPLEDENSNVSDGDTTSSDGNPFPVTITADNGEITIDEQPTAIVSLSPSITEMIYAVDAGEQVTAVDVSSDYPPGTPVTDLSGFRPNIEGIGALEPDLVFVARDRDGVVATLEDVGITVVLLEAPDSIEGVYEQIETVGAATGRSDRAAQVAEDLEADIDDLVAQLPERDEPLTYFYELTDGYNTVTSDTFVGSVLALAGMVNIADGADPTAGGYPQLTAEYVLGADPDVIFLAHGSGPAPTPDELASRPGWSELTAVQQDRVVALDADIASRWGPRVVELLAVVIEATAEVG